MLKKLRMDEKAGGAVALKILTVNLIIITVIALLLDSIYVGICYFYIKTQMDMANRAVYAEIDRIRLADRELYIDKTDGEAKFYEYLKKNLKLNENLEPIGLNMRIEGPIKVLDIIIYNESDLPAITPVGTNIDMVSVHSRIEVHVRPIFIGIFTNVTIRPYIDTDLPDKLVKNFQLL